MSEQVPGRYVGQSVPRRADRWSITGDGHYVEDVAWPGTLHVAFLSEAPAMVIATSRYLAQDGVGLIDVDLDTEQAILTEPLGFDGVAADTENLVHPAWASNLAQRLPGPTNSMMPTENPALDETIVTAAHVVTETFDQHRYIYMPMERRGTVGHRRKPAHHHVPGLSAAHRERGADHRIRPRHHAVTDPR